MDMPKPVTIDFETFGVESRPDYPPKPVGVSIKYPGKLSRYYAFGHPSRNNYTWDDAKKAVRAAYKSKGGVLFQNGKFDIDVAETWFKLKPPPWSKIHDTMFLLFLDDPHQKSLELKPSSERILGWPPEEQDAVRDYLIRCQPVEGVKISGSKSSPHYFGRYIAYAPGNLAGVYANGDVDRTEALFYKLYPSIVSRGMLEAYDRERRLMPVLLEMERQGVPVNLQKLNSDVGLYTHYRDILNSWIVKKLKCPHDINLNSGSQLFSAMLEAGAIDESKALLTKTGKFQTNKEALLAAVTNKQLISVLQYRAQLNTCLDTFMIPWLRVAEKSGGLIYTQWNQVRLPKEGGSVGTRTGRLSSTPNFQNIPNEFKPLFKHEAFDSSSRQSLPRCPISGLPPLPKVRGYIIPFPGDVLIDRDYSQQEIRILGHYDPEGAILKRYAKDPWLDFHELTQKELALAGKMYDRKPVKNTNFGIIYGMGVGKLAEKNGTTVAEAKNLKTSILLLYPGLKNLYSDMRQRSKLGEPIHTWGGREYYCEPPTIVEGSYRTHDYKLVNVLIQGSAADCTKEAIIRFHAVKKKCWKILLNVHDQVTVSVPVEDLKEAMEILKNCLESVEFDVVMLSEGRTSSTNWDALADYDKKGVLV